MDSNRSRSTSPAGSDRSRSTSSAGSDRSRSTSSAGSDSQDQSRTKESSEQRLNKNTRNLRTVSDSSWDTSKTTVNEEDRNKAIEQLYRDMQEDKEAYEKRFDFPDEQQRAQWSAQSLQERQRERMRTRQGPPS